MMCVAMFLFENKKLSFRVRSSGLHLTDGQNLEARSDIIAKIALNCQVMIHNMHTVTLVVVC